MDPTQLIRERLAELGRDQKDLAVAAEVTESYVSQLLTGKKPPPAPARTRIYGKMEAFLGLGAGTLSGLVELQRADALRRRLGRAPAPRNAEVREFLLRKCRPSSEARVRAEFAKDAFGPLERLVTQKLLDVAKSAARQEPDREDDGRAAARGGARRARGANVAVRELLELDVLGLSMRHCETFLDPRIESWDIDLVRFGMDIVLNRRLGRGRARRLELVEAAPPDSRGEEPGFREFLRDPALRGDATEAEIAFLAGLRFDGRRPTALYYYRELQSLRDPLHFREARPGSACASERSTARDRRGPVPRAEAGSGSAGPGLGSRSGAPSPK